MVYLDNSATAPPLSAAIKEVSRVMRETDWNPSALYRPAIDAERIVSGCREDLKARLGADHVIFTSGGTEADNLAIRGAASRLRKPGTFLFSAAEHAAVLEQQAALEAIGNAVRIIPLTPDGLVDTVALEALLTPGTRLISVMDVSNETGAVQPIPEIIALRNKKCPSAMVFVDAAQSFMRMDRTRRLLASGVDMVSVSAHKVHGPKGVGALALATGRRSKLNPVTFGGGQEDGLRPGTENVAGIAGFHAAMIALDECGFNIVDRLRENKLRFLSILAQSMPDVWINGPSPSSDQAAPHIVNLSTPGIGGEVLVRALEREGVYVGTGSACSSKKKQRSPGFLAMGVQQERADRAIRVSLSPLNTAEDMTQAAAAIVRAHHSIYPYRKR
ncbi:MAG: cysteine desulfurase [Oscillospiraceae bacterium]|jgi:cysteine desulfurase|nr:cysteine desulfurase [Oscillospiraceae bacterium]